MSLSDRQLPALALARTRSLAASAGTAMLDFTQRAQRELWVGVAVVMTADLALTAVGLAHGLAERNPVARWALAQAGIAGLAGLKMFALCLAACCWFAVPRRYGSVIPLGLILPSAVAVGVNAVLVWLVV
jgi:hypothetical protein